MKKSTDVFSLLLNDLEGEIWIDAIGFDGIYEVSNLGRVKSLGRYVRSPSGERWVRERIRKLHINKKDRRISMGLSISNVVYSVNLPEIIYLSFNPKENLNGYVVAHLNKIPYDNRLCNLKKLTYKESRKISEDLGTAPPAPVRGQLKYTKENTVYENGVAKEKKCKECNTIKKISSFDPFRNTCQHCRYVRLKILKSKK
jgi:hypothetical protein